MRQLGASDRTELAELLDGEPGYSLFLSGNLGLLGARIGYARYWAAYLGGRMCAALMMVGRRATLYAPPGAPLRPLAGVTVAQGLDFAMGRSDLVDVLLAADPHHPQAHRQEHILASLDPARGAEVRIEPPRSGQVRRARMADLTSLTALYTGAAGFEAVSTAQVRTTMRGRISTLRTYLAEVDGEIVAAASTTAEAPLAAMIGGVWTAPAWRGQGLSTAVVAVLSRELLGEHRAPYLFYLEENAPAARVYAKIGYQPVGPWTVVYLDRSYSA
jgi:GNAT superfamily N-acetyltransferase